MPRNNQQASFHGFVLSEPHTHMQPSLSQNMPMLLRFMHIKMNGEEGERAWGAQGRGGGVSSGGSAAGGGGKEPVGCAQRVGQQVSAQVVVWKGRQQCPNVLVLHTENMPLSTTRMGHKRERWVRGKRREGTVLQPGGVIRTRITGTCHKKEAQNRE